MTDYKSIFSIRSKDNIDKLELPDIAYLDTNNVYKIKEGRGELMELKIVNKKDRELGYKLELDLLKEVQEKANQNCIPLEVVSLEQIENVLLAFHKVSSNYKL